MLGFQPDDEQQLIRDTVAEFAREQLRPLAHAADESGLCPPLRGPAGLGPRPGAKHDS